MSSRLIIPLLGVSVFAFACGPRQHTEASSARTVMPSVANAATAPRFGSRKPSSRRDNSIESRLLVLRTDDALRFALQVANAGTKRIELTFPDGQTHEIVVTDSIGRRVWQWSEGRLFTQGMRTTTIAGGDTLDVSGRWEQPAATGTLTATATLRSENYPVEQRVTFVLP